MWLNLQSLWNHFLNSIVMPEPEKPEIMESPNEIPKPEIVENPIKTHIDYAIAEIGNTEIPKGSNWGVHVQKYLHSVGIDFPASWCMAFVYWCVNQTGNNPLIKTGGVLRQWNEIPLKYKIYKDPKPGDIFIMDFGKGLGHTGFVEAVNGINIDTIEGNSNDEGSRDGYEVCRRTRKISTCKGFIRI